MKYTAIIPLILLTANAYAEIKPLTASLADPTWDGKTVPAGQQCQKFGGKGSTPLISVNDIPEGANAIVMEYSDHTYQAMNHGGHGKFGYRIPTGSTTVTIPSMAGQTFDLPSGFFLIEAQRAPDWDKAGAYLPPCSGGSGNDYYVTVKAVKEVKGGIREVLAETEVPLGKY